MKAADREMSFVVKHRYHRHGLVLATRLGSVEGPGSANRDRLS